MSTRVTAIRHGLLILGLLLFAISVMCNYLLYSSFSDDAIYKSTYSTMSILFDFSKITLAFVIGLLFFAYNAPIFGFIASIFWLILTTISIISAFGFFAVVNANMESKALVASTTFKNAELSVLNSQSKLDSLSQYADPSAASAASTKITALENELETYLTQRAVNSRGVDSGTIGSRTANCAGRDSWYSRKYCSEAQRIRREIKQQQAIVSNHNAYKGALVAKESRVTALSSMDIGSVGSSHIHPLFVGLGKLFSYDANYIKYIFLICSSILCELLGSFNLVLFSRIGFSTESVPSYTQGEQQPLKSQLKPVKTSLHSKPINSTLSENLTNLEGILGELITDIQSKNISNLSFASIKQWGTGRSLNLKQPDIKQLREGLIQSGVVVKDATRKLIAVT